MKPGSEKITYRHGMAPTYWQYSWGSLPYGAKSLPRSDDLHHLPERWVALERRIWQQFIEKIANRTELKVLDVGCGAGKMIQFLLENNIEPQNITALDENEQLINWCSAIWRDVRFLKLNAVDLDQIPKPNSFDLVISHMLFNLLDEKAMRNTLVRIYASLNQSGILAIQLPSPQGKRKQHPGLTNQTCLIYESTPWGNTPYYWRSEEHIIAVLEEIGFEVLDASNYSYGSFDENTVHFTNAIGVNRDDLKRILIVCQKK